MALEIARRAAGEYEGSELGAFLAELAGDIEADRGALEDIMAGLLVSPDRLKTTLAWLGEKVGRLKLNGELLRSSPLSPVIELEVLTLGVHGKQALWRTLGELAETDARLDAAWLAELAARAEGQLEALERHHRAAVARAFAA